MQITAVLLAAGLGTRAGGDKLARPFRGKPLIEYASGLIASLPFCRRIAVVRPSDTAIISAVKNAGIESVFNPEPEHGIASSIVLGLAKATENWNPDGILFLVGDQPLLKLETILDMLAAFEREPGTIIRLQSADGTSGNPCLFPNTFFGELSTLSGDTGGRQVIRRHPDRVRFIPCGTEELHDFDSTLDFDLPEPL